MLSVRPWLGAAALACGSTLVAVGGLEIALRLREAFLHKDISPASRGFFWMRQPDYGWTHIPDHEGIWNNDAGEFEVKVRTNSKGLRDVEHDYEKKPGVFRILVLGDSYMEGMQVDLEQTFPRLLEATLQRQGLDVEVINSGVADWGTDNELAYYRTEGWKYHADLVLLAFTTANDVRNNSPVLNARVPNPNLYKPSFTLAADGSLVPHPSPPLPADPPVRTDAPWWAGLRSVRFFVNRLPRLFPAPPAAPAGPLSDPAVAAPAPQRDDVPTDMLVYQPFPAPELQDAWAVTKALVLALRDDVEKQGARFALFMVNGPWAHYDDRWKRMLLRRPAAVQTWNRRQPNTVLGLFLLAKKIPSMDLFASFEAAKRDAPLFFRIDSHWTPAGHRVAADSVARFAIDAGLVPRPASQARPSPHSVSGASVSIGSAAGLAVSRMDRPVRGCTRSVA